MQGVTISKKEICMAGKKRIEYIDIAKGIGIILVVAGHLLDKESELCKFIYSFHMPLFFVLSGLLLKENRAPTTFSNNIRKQKKLMKQYFVYSAVFWLFDCIIRVFILSELEVSQLVWNAYKTITLYGINVLWFIPTLCIAKICASELLKHFGMVKGSIVSVVCFHCVAIVGNYLTMEVASQSIFVLLLYFPVIAFVRSLGMVCFLFAGYFLQLSIPKKIFRIRNHRLDKLVSIAVLFLITLFYSKKNNLVDVHFIMFGKPILTLIVGVSGSFMIVLLSQMLERIGIIKKILLIFGRNSLPIMAIHQYLFVSSGCEFALKVVGIKNVYLGIALTCIVSACIAELVNYEKKRIAIKKEARTG